MAKDKSNGEEGTAKNSKESKAKFSKHVQRKLERQNQKWVQVAGTGKGSMKKDKVYVVSEAAAEILIAKGVAK